MSLYKINSALVSNAQTFAYTSNTFITLIYTRVMMADCSVSIVTADLTQINTITLTKITLSNMPHFPALPVKMLKHPSNEKQNDISYKNLAKCIHFKR